MSKEEKPREYWIVKPKDERFFPAVSFKETSVEKELLNWNEKDKDFLTVTHVIDKSAYDKLKRENERLKYLKEYEHLVEIIEVLEAFSEQEEIIERIKNENIKRNI